MPLSLGLPRQEYWSGLPFPPPGNLPNPGIEPVSLGLLHHQAGSLPLCHLRYMYLPFALNCYVLFHCIKHILIRLFSSDSNLDCLKLISCKCFSWYICECFSGVGKIKRNFHIVCIFKMFKYCQISIQSDCLKCYSHQQCMAVSLYIYLQFIYLSFLIFANIMGQRYYLIDILICMLIVALVGLSNFFIHIFATFISNLFWFYSLNIFVCLSLTQL